MDQRLPAEHPSQPHLVQLGCLLIDDSGAEWATLELIVKPEGYVIPNRAAAVHGVTTELARAVGVPLLIAVAAFTNLRAIATRLVAHNMEFDDLVMRAAIHRTGRKPAHPGPGEWFCTMRAAGPIMELPPTARMLAAGYDKWKPPNLMEAHEHFTGSKFEGAHGALSDARACAKVYAALMKLKGEEKADAETLA